MYDTDEDVTPVDAEGNNSPNLTHLEDEESYVSDSWPTEVEENVDNEEYDYMRMKKTFHKLSECWRHSTIHAHMMNGMIQDVKLSYIKDQLNCKNQHS
jgi:hypothetical protein